MPLHDTRRVSTWGLIAGACLAIGACRGIAGYAVAPTPDATRVDGSPTDLAADGADVRVDGTGDGSGSVEGGASSGSVALIDGDPFFGQPAADFAFVTKYAGQLYLGPNGNGSGAVRMDADGQHREAVVFRLPKDIDATGSTSSNKTTTTPTPPPFVSVGYGGCPKDTNSCGPDNEDARGFFASGTLGGVEWLLLAGGRADANFHYVYTTTETSTSLGFGYVDLAEVVGSATHGVSALHSLQGSICLGFPDTGGSKPHLTQLTALPSNYVNGTEGLDLSASSSVWGADLGAGGMPAIGGQQQIDTIIDFNNRLYLFNAGGCTRSTTPVPSPYDKDQSNWATCTPSPLAASRPPTSAVEVAPTDKAFPQAAVLDGVLYVGHNTAAGPRVLACRPDLDPKSDPTTCESGEWQVAASLNDPSASVTLVLAPDKPPPGEPRWLYVGFEDPTRGVRVFRGLPPLGSSGLMGLAQCEWSKAQCEGLGGNGFRLLGVDVKHIYDAKVLEFAGRSNVYLTAGDPKGATRLGLFRLAD